jgi:hypothetical protein
MAGTKIKLLQWALENILRAPADVPVFLGDRAREGASYVWIESHALWVAEPWSRKLRAILRLKWEPDTDEAERQAIETYRSRIFGTDDDWGHHLLLLNAWHLQREWQLTSLMDRDRLRASALMSFTVLTRLRYRDIAASSLNLRLGARLPLIAGLVYPMIAKTPVVSMMYFLELDAQYAFDAIRSAQHPLADDLVGFLYELLFLQQKVAIGLLEFLRLVAYADEHKKGAQLINAEVNAIMAADGIFANLKGSVEKTIALVGIIYGIKGLDAKKDHKKRLAALRAGLPEGVEKLFYADFLFETVSTENLEDLNNYRTGLLHKKGIADLQPHNYIAKDAKAVPLRQVFRVMHEQHSKNTAALLVALALLTDDLARRDPPPFSMADVPHDLIRREMRKMVEDAAKAGEALEVADGQSRPDTEAR